MKISIWHKATEKQPPLTGEWIMVRYNGLLYVSVYYGELPGQNNSFFWVVGITNNVGKGDFHRIEWAEEIEVPDEMINNILNPDDWAWIN